MLGLDLQGGTELVYQGRPTPQVPDVNPEDIDRAIEIIRERVDSLGVSEPEITRVGEDQIEVGLPERLRAPTRATEQIGTTAQLYLYDFEPNVIPPNPDIANPEEPPVQPADRRGRGGLEAARGLRGAVRAAGLHGERRHLLPVRRQHAAADRRAVGGHARTCSSTPRTSKQPADTKVVAVPQGTVVVEDEARRRPGDRGRRRVRRRPRSSSSSTTSPALAGDEITDPKPGTDQFQPADRRLQLHRRGPRGVRRASPRQIAQRGRRRLLRRHRQPVRRDLLRRGRAVLGLVRDRPRRRAGLAADHQLRRQPERDRRPHRRPDLGRHRRRRPRTSPRC